MKNKSQQEDKFMTKLRKTKEAINHNIVKAKRVRNQRRIRNKLDQLVNQLINQENLVK